MTKFLRVATAALLATTLVLTAARSQSFLLAGGPAGLVTSKTVTDDIKATDEQVQKLKAWAKEHQDKQREFFKAFKDSSDGERAKQRTALTADAWKAVGKVLKDDQVKRLKQIELQVAGTSAFSRPEVAEALKITDDQKDRIEESLGFVAEDLQALNKEFGGNGFFPPKLDNNKKKEYDAKLAELSKKRTIAMYDGLTADQKAKWKEMTGDPIDVAKVQAESRPNFGNFKKKD
jgi:hypothetical protein